MADARLLALVAFAHLGGCSAAPAAGPLGPRPVVAPARAPDLDPGRLGELRSLRFCLRLPLPAIERWIVDDRSKQWLVAHDPGTRSELWLRSWRTGRRQAPADCEAEAHSLLPFWPRLESNEILEETELEVPTGFHTRVLTGARARAEHGSVEGYALAVGWKPGRCFAVAYVTRAQGPEAAEQVGSRLGLMATRVLSQVRILSVEDRAHEARPER